jgi:hypothetical protein
MTMIGHAEEFSRLIDDNNTPIQRLIRQQYDKMFQKQTPQNITNTLTFEKQHFERLKR